jgi:hypothetical protein
MNRPARSSLARAAAWAPWLAAVWLSLPSAAAAQTLIDIATDATDPANLADTEPSIAVNPQNPQEIVVVTFSEGWGPGLPGPVWKSDDGGATWRKVFQLTQPAPTSFGPGDQKIAFSTAGDLHIVELGMGIAVPRCLVFRQTAGPDDALTTGALFGDDQPHLEIDRSGGGFADRLYAPWLDFAPANQRSTVVRSTNFGAGVANVAAGDNSSFPNRTTRIAVGADGRAYIIYKTREGGAGGGFENAHFRVHRSDDGGVTWNANGASGVSVHGAGQVQTWFTSSWGNIAKGKVARARSSDAWIAVDPGDGDVYAAYVDRDASGFGQIYVARSTNGGASWTSTRATDGTHHSAFPEIAVTANGVVGVLYVDFDDSGPATIFRHRFAQSSDDGATWSDQNLQSMDPGPLANATSGFLWGDYEGLTAHGSTFYGVFTGASIGRGTPQLDPIFFSVRTGPQIQVPGDVALGDVCVGSTGSGTLHVCNTGKEDLVVTAIASSNPAVSVTPPSAGFPVTISHDFCFPFQVVFAAAAAGPQSATLTISSNDLGAPSTTVQVSGNGTEQNIQVAGSTDFGVASAWMPAERTVGVCNAGACTLTVTGATVSCPDFTLVGAPVPAALGPGACLDLVVRFTPQLPGAKSCTLDIASDDPDSPVVSRTLTARTPPFFSVHAGLVDPHGALAAVADQGSTVNLDFVYNFLPNWAWDLRLGGSSFDGTAGSPDTDVSTLSANAKFTFNPAAPVRVFLNGGLGLYHFSPGDFEGGGNLGLGLNIPAGALFAIEATYNYHSAFTAAPDLEFSQVQLGLLISF